MRMRNKPWALDFLSEHKSFIDIDESHQLDITSRFKKQQPIHLEIGTGMGRFITTLAKRHPEINFVGVELDKNIMIRVVEKAIEMELDNLQLVLLDANHLRDYFNADEVSHIYLNFSDPWPKNRHEKRRLTHKNFLKQYKEILKVDGMLQFKTDNRGLFEFSLEHLNNFGMKFHEINLNVHEMESPENIRTEYEDKFSSRGNLIYQLKASF
ncbi:tRNA (guanosine(46)-N7)-methyltransferase TrmB [Aliicoccus persicus]|uniref:tRNA (guanine-N(7)-)-methyltransferase n=1 Tax=Aliicoccus persicus TaxID=930138 RepID=A0A662Z1R9_9STAP|nr:tRNA (guanosine(46)-N7)-methyltransferase TrmB [Aliicoccus persicus]SEV87790.1 tRNA (guanine-N(7)-)-methyltransferase [Aliicoccus persicus]